MERRRKEKNYERKTELRNKGIRKKEQMKGKRNKYIM
jgi:hypothetical protein